MASNFETDVDTKEEELEVKTTSQFTLALLRDNAREAFLAHDFETALGIYAEALRVEIEEENKDEEHSKLFLNMGRCLNGLKAYNLALDYCRRARKLRPTWFKPYYCEADLLDMLEKHGGAVMAFKKAIKYAPEESKAGCRERVRKLELKQEAKARRERGEEQFIFRLPMLQVVSDMKVLFGQDPRLLEGDIPVSDEQPILHHLMSIISDEYVIPPRFASLPDPTPPNNFFRFHLDEHAEEFRKLEFFAARDPEQQQEILNSEASTTSLQEKFGFTPEEATQFAEKLTYLRKHSPELMKFVKTLLKVSRERKKVLAEICACATSKSWCEWEVRLYNANEQFAGKTLFPNAYLLVLSIGDEIENFHICKKSELNEGINLMLRISILRGLNRRSSQNTAPVSVRVITGSPEINMEKVQEGMTPETDDVNQYQQTIDVEFELLDQTAFETEAHDNEVAFAEEIY